MVANADLFRAMACQEIAEMLAPSGESKAAASLYVDAVTRLVAWKHRKWLVGPAGIVDDSGLDEFAGKQPSGKVVDGRRDSWFELWYGVLIPPPANHSEPRPFIGGDAPASRAETRVPPALTSVAAARGVNDE